MAAVEVDKKDLKRRDTWLMKTLPSGWGCHLHVVRHLCHVCVVLLAATNVRSVMPERHWLGMTSAGCELDGVVGRVHGVDQDKADLSDGKAALIKQGRGQARHPAGHACKRCDDSRAQAGMPAMRWAPASCLVNISGSMRTPVTVGGSVWQAHARGGVRRESGTDPEILGMWLVSALYLWSLWG
ncbi:hypothetical protein HAX54_041628 [Datura stramonium]|uniref:Uncharacterized protein n=1 Tax=Datura stramonium TaxID=4076 RepID=A0ABS8W2U2_DATST|nr:hypothetical protein [Datura stramonium]